MRRTALALALAPLAAATALGQPTPRPTTTLPLAVTTALEGDAPVVDDAWIDAQLEQANLLFAPHGVAFVVVERHTMPERHARLENRRDRHLLGHRLHRQRVDAFFVRSLRDVDEPDRMRQGVHWRPRGEGYDPRAHYVIVSSIAGPTVLAHELGHYFGNGHSDVPGNVMSYERGDRPPFFDAAQGARIRGSLRRFLERGELVAADGVSPGPAR